MPPPPLRRARRRRSAPRRSASPRQREQAKHSRAGRRDWRHKRRPWPSRAHDVTRTYLRSAPNNDWLARKTRTDRMSRCNGLSRRFGELQNYRRTFYLDAAGCHPQRGTLLISTDPYRYRRVSNLRYHALVHVLHVAFCSVCRALR